MVDPEDMSSFDADIGTSTAAEPKAVEGQYRMKHTNEKFSLGGARPLGGDNPAQQEESITQDEPPPRNAPVALTEEEELQRALAQIREMENRELIAKEEADASSKVQEYLQQGEFVYELYSIMIHSGGAYGGHYYAYIKSFEDGKWYNFNDSSVT